MLKSKKLRNLIITVCLTFVIFALGDFAYAQDANSLLFGGKQGTVGNILGLGSGDPRIIIASIIRVLLGFLGIIAVGYIMYAGFLWMTSEGDEGKIEKAKDTLKNALIGLIIILASFGIASFIISRLYGGGGAGGPGSSGGPSGPGNGFGAIGSCTVESVYPEPNQTNVPRNTTVIVTFKEEVDIATICNDDGSGGATAGDGQCTGGEYILPLNARIYKTAAGDACDLNTNPTCTGNVTDVNVIPSVDKKTFVFIFNTYLGSPSEFIWYTMYLTNSIEKFDKSGLRDGIFSTCNPDYLEWKFEVNNLIDLTPPQVLNKGVFPPPDNNQDIYATAAAAAAVGKITVNNQPAVYTAAKFGSLNSGGNPPAANLTIDPNCQDNGDFIITIKSPTIAELSNKITGNLLGTANLSGSSFAFPNYFTLNITGNTNNLAAGQWWDILNVTPMTPADTLTVGNTVYTFVSGAPAANEIQSSSNNNATAANIASILNYRSDLIAASAQSAVNLTAEIAGAAGNNIGLSASNSSVLTIILMSGGTDAKTTQTVKDKPDQPKNSVIQVNFNEAINPITVSGNATDVQNNIKVKCFDAAGAPCALVAPDFFACGADTCVDGKFMVSNIYKTVEFVANILCGVNGCGEKIYCLPGSSNLKVELTAANLAACNINLDCASKSPYANCNNQVCQDANGINYPLSKLPFDGIMDAALNSLDGNRDGDADGPASYYDENNIIAGNGDNYKWSFWTSNSMNLTPPIISLTTPAHTIGGIQLTAPVYATFDKLMMSASLMTGLKNIFNGNIYIAHKLINIWNFSSKPLGYWISKIDIDSIAPLDGWPDNTQAIINHSDFYDSTSYRSQIGSGVKDIYQNCFKPSKGPGCSPLAPNESCCPSGININPANVLPGNNCP